LQWWHGDLLRLLLLLCQQTDLLYPLHAGAAAGGGAVGQAAALLGMAPV
jgi:hypothetical protein